MGNRSQPLTSNEQSSLSRRKVLAMSGMMAATGLAGCNSDGEANDDTTTDEQADVDTPADSGGTPIDPVVNIPHSAAFDPGNFNMNTYASTGHGEGFYGQWSRMLDTPTILPAYGEEVPMLGIESQSIDESGCVLERTLRDGLTYYDGTEVTTENIRVNYWINLYRSVGVDASEEHADQTLEIVDDYTYRWHYNSPQNAFNQKWRRNKLNTNPAWYGQYLEAYEDATTDEEVDDINEELSSATISLDEYADQGLGSGMWKPDSWDELSMTWTKVEDHPLADRTNIEEIKWEGVPDATKRVERFKRDDFDVVAWGDLGNVNADSSQEIEKIDQFGFNSTIDLRFNYANEHLGNRDVRRAIAYIIDFEKMVQALEGSGVPSAVPEYLTGAPTNTGKQVMGEEWLSSLIDYGMTAQPEKAEQAMQDAGYSKDGDVWVDSSGNQTEGLSFYSLDFPKTRVSAEYLSSVLNQFGIKNDIFFPNYGEYTERLQESQDFDLIQYWTNARAGGGYAPGCYVVPSEGYRYPGSIEDFDDSLPSDFEPPTAEGCERVEYEAPPIENEKGPIYSIPNRPEYPAEVGAKTMDGETKTLYPLKMRWEADQTASEEEVQDISREFAWYTNFDMAKMPLFNETTVINADTTNFAWRNDIPIAKNHRPSIQAAWGRMSSKTE